MTVPRASMPPPEIGSRRKFSPVRGRRIAYGPAWRLGILLFAAAEALAAGDPSKRHFDIPHGAAEAALQAFVEQARVDLVYNIDKIEGVKTNRVKGRMTVGEALDRLVANTGLAIVKDEKSGALTLDRSPPATAPGRPDNSVKKNESPTPQTQQPMKRNRLLVKLTATLALTFAPAAPADAQTVAAANGAAEQKEETIELSPFIVDTSKDVGYLAGNTLAGTRLNQSLKDTAASISVFTPEFISDIGAFDLTDVLAYAVNSEPDFLDDDTAAPAYPQGTGTVMDQPKYRVRGLKANLALDYFEWTNLPTDVYNIERIEDSRGPNSVLFGIGSPGGIINMSTKQALTGRSFNKLTLTAASNASFRASIDSNQSLRQGTFAVRLNLLADKMNSYRHWAFKENRRASLAMTYKLLSNTWLRGQFERGEVNENFPRFWTLDDAYLAWDAAGRQTSAVQAANASLGIGRLSTSTAQPRVTYISNGQTAISMQGTLSSRGTGYAILDESIADRTINIGGPDQTRHTRFNVFSTYLEHRFSRRTSLEFAFRHADDKFDRYDARFSNGLNGDPNQLLNTGAANPYAGGLYLESPWFVAASASNSDRGRASFTSGFDARKWGSYQLGAHAEYYKSWATGNVFREIWVDTATGKPAYNAVPENVANLVYRRSYITEGDWGGYYVTGPNRSNFITNVTDPVTGKTLSSKYASNGNITEVFSTQKTYMVAGQARYFKDQLVIGGGIRRDELKTQSLGKLRDPVTNETVINRDPSRGGAPTFDVGRNTSFGAVYHVIPKISVFYNIANNIALPARANIMDLSGDPGFYAKIPASKGRGRDYGVAFNLLEGRMYIRTNYYKSAGTNLTRNLASGADGVERVNRRILETLFAEGLIDQAEFDTRWGIPEKQRYDQTADGYELQITANPTKNWRLQVNYSRTNAVNNNVAPEWRAWDVQNEKWLAQFDINNLVTDAGRTIAQEVAVYKESLHAITDLDGLSEYGRRPNKVNLFTRYGFSSGPLSGVFVGGGYKYQDRNFVGVAPDGRSLYGNSFWTADFLAGYKVRRMSNKRTLEFQLNVYNVFDNTEPNILRYSPDATTIRSIAVQAPISWRLTTSLGF